MAKNSPFKKSVRMNHAHSLSKFNPKVKTYAFTQFSTNNLINPKKNNLLNTEQIEKKKFWEEYDDADVKAILLFYVLILLFAISTGIILFCVIGTYNVMTEYYSLPRYLLEINLELSKIMHTNALLHQRMTSLENHVIELTQIYNADNSYANYTIKTMYSGGIVCIIYMGLRIITYPILRTIFPV